TEPGSVWRELCHHESGPAFLSIVAGTAVLGSDAVAFGICARFSLALFGVAVLSWLFIIYCFLAMVTEGRNKPPLEKGLSGSWLLVVVSTASLAVLGSDLLRDLGRPQALVFFCYFGLVLAWFYYIVLASLILYRFAFVPMSATEIAGPWWINEGAAAITVLAGTKLMEQPGLSIGPYQLRALIAPFVAIFWADATFWIPLLVLLFAWKHLVRMLPFRYSSELWSVVFPLGTYSVATLHFAAVYGLSFLVPVARVVFWLAMLLWALSVIGMIGQASGRKIVIVP
ncbi:MAG: tellurite resistance/C4-dicarboxylate transporter family protein, partial [Acetobacteraceae bacterium]|nr:tellurite resistance/C4-dicarboxylate transporter family protein [Acetobacteraceae bacterium]